MNFDDLIFSLHEDIEKAVLSKYCFVVDENTIDELIDLDSGILAVHPWGVCVMSYNLTNGTVVHKKFKFGQLEKQKSFIDLVEQKERGSVTEFSTFNRSEVMSEVAPSESANMSNKVDEWIYINNVEHFDNNVKIEGYMWCKSLGFMLNNVKSTIQSIALSLKEELTQASLTRIANRVLKEVANDHDGCTITTHVVNKIPVVEFNTRSGVKFFIPGLIYTV